MKVSCQCYEYGLQFAKYVLKFIVQCLLILLFALCRHHACSINLKNKTHWFWYWLLILEAGLKCRNNLHQGMMFSNGISWPTVSKTSAGLAERFLSALAEHGEINALHYCSFTVIVVNMLGLYYCYKIPCHSWAHLIEPWLCPTHLLPLPASLECYFCNCTENIPLHWAAADNG